ncbi:MAG: hypothetical protein R2704_00575 [Microthrixaceae bacterium]
MHNRAMFVTPHRRRDCGGASEDLNTAVDQYNTARSEYVAAVRVELGTN